MSIRLMLLILFSYTHILISCPAKRGENQLSSVNFLALLVSGKIDTTVSCYFPIFCMLHNNFLASLICKKRLPYIYIKSNTDLKKLKSQFRKVAFMPILLHVYPNKLSWNTNSSDNIYD